MNDSSNRSMLVEIKTVYDALHQDVAWLHVEWKVYRELFGTTENRVDLLNQAAPDFAYVIQGIMQDSVYLGITRLFDSVRVCGHEILTLKQLGKLLLQHADMQFCDNFDAAIMEIERTGKPFLDHRHTRLAHSNLQQSLTGSFDRPSRTTVEEALSAIRSAMNMLSEYFGGSPCAYESSFLLGGGESLLYFLRNGLRLRELMQLLYSGQINVDELTKKLQMMEVEKLDPPTSTDGNNT